MSPSITNRPVTVAVLLAAALPSLALNNGVARTPPMGFNPYNSLFIVMEEQRKGIADAMVESGLYAAGWNYVNEDVGGLNSRMINPGGAKAVCDYVHSKGLKIGMYTFPPRDNVTANPGITNMANNIASWGVDYLKYDGWSDTPASAFTQMRDALAATGRPVCYMVNGAQGASIANQWRTSGDIDARWESWTGCISTNAGGGSAPGGWGDPDLLQIECGMASFDEEQAMFSLWCVSSSPLITCTDFRYMFLSTHYIVLNTEAIAVNQDTAFSVNSSYGGSGKRIRATGTEEVWMKTVTGGAKAVVLFNKGAAAASMTVNWTDIGLAAGTAQVRDLWEHRNLGSFTNSYSAQVPAHGCAFVKIVAGSTAIPQPAATWYPKPQAPIPVTPLAKTGWTVSISGVSMVGDAQQLVDGNNSSGPFADLDQTSPGIFTFDMKTSQVFNSVIISNATDKVGPFLKPYKVYNSVHWWVCSVSDNGTTWRGVDSGWGGPMNYNFFTFSNQTARYIRLVHSFVNCRFANYDYSGDENRGGLRYGIGEIYVANSSEFPVKVRPAADPSLFAIVPAGMRPAPRMCVVTNRQMPVSFLEATGLPVYSIDGRRIAGQSYTIVRSGILVRNPRQ